MKAKKTLRDEFAIAALSGMYGSERIVGRAIDGWKENGGFRET